MWAVSVLERMSEHRHRMIEYVMEALHSSNEICKNALDKRPSFFCMQR